MNGNQNQSQKIYLDYASATPVLNEVYLAIKPYFCEQFGNPSSLHQYGLIARDAINQARVKVAELINAETAESIYFTSGNTESANWAIKGVAESLKRYGNHIVLSAIEQPAVAESVEWLESQGFTATRVKVNEYGLINPEDIEKSITDKTILIAVQIANPDIGVIQPVEELTKIAEAHGIIFYADADAAIGYYPIDVQRLKVDLLSFSAQQLYGPKGVGVLYKARKARLSNLMHGGSQEGGRRPGIENVPAVVGIGKAAEIAKTNLLRRIERARKLQVKLWDLIKTRISHIKLNGPPLGDLRLPCSLNISIEFVEGEGVALLCDMNGLAITSGTACSSRATKVPQSLKEIGLSSSLAQSSILMSWGENTTEEEIERAVEILAKSVDKLRQMSAGWKSYTNGKIKPITPEWVDKVD